jgi:cytochrome b subunit of formate dehydrogenase
MTQPSVLRHRLADRLFHWTMAAALLVCLFTAFLPILGWKFAWVTPHWIGGIVLTASILFHIVRAIVWQDFWSIAFGPRDVRQCWQAVRQTLGGGPSPQGSAKDSPLQKLFHAAVTVLVLILIASGLLMLSKIDTVFWRRNPDWLAESDWGMIYAAHGLSAMAMITLIMLHVYFALRPEKLWITASMIHGRISWENYRRYHDPRRWPVPNANAAAAGDGADAAGMTLPERRRQA